MGHQAICQNEKCEKTYLAKRSTSKFCQPPCRTAQHKLDKKRDETLLKLLSKFPSEAKRINDLESYDLKNRFLDMAAIPKNLKTIPLILDMIWSMNHSVAWQKQNKIDHLQLEINTLQSNLKDSEDKAQESIDGVSIWQL